MHGDLCRFLVSAGRKDTRGRGQNPPTPTLADIMPRIRLPCSFLSPAKIFPFALLTLQIWRQIVTRLNYNNTLRAEEEPLKKNQPASYNCLSMSNANGMMVSFFSGNRGSF